MRVRLDFVGMLVAIGMFYLSVTPSLLPRPWLLQGVLTGLCAALGYLVGVGLGKLARRREPSGRVLALVAVPLVLLCTYRGALWQRDVAALTGKNPPSVLSYFLVPVVAGGIFVALLAVARGSRWITRRLEKALSNRLAAVSLVLIAFMVVLAGVGYSAVSIMNSNFRGTDEVIQPRPPLPAERSGSDQSLVSWESLGSLGRAFVAGGPSVRDIEQFTGRPAKQPIRVYAGRQSAPQTAILAARELERTDAFSRKVLCVVVTTGRGLVDENFIEPLEYMHNGDTAVVAIQYSYQASWLSFLTGRSQVRNAARELFGEVHTRWSRLPVESRPRLVVFGESLGAYGADSIFHDTADMRARVDGALFAGPPAESPNWRRGVTDPRIVYLHHASDPVVHWSPDLMLRSPRWLRSRGSDVSQDMEWYPLVTFGQLTVDLIVGNDVPSGHGHNYRDEAVTAWSQVLPPTDWSESRGEILRSFLAR